MSKHISAAFLGMMWISERPSYDWAWRRWRITRYNVMMTLSHWDLMRKTPGSVLRSWSQLATKRTRWWFFGEKIAKYFSPSHPVHSHSLSAGITLSCDRPGMRKQNQIGENKTRYCDHPQSGSDIAIFYSLNVFTVKLSRKERNEVNDFYFICTSHVQICHMWWFVMHTDCTIYA